MMFIVSIYDPPESGKAWSACKTGDIADAITYEYEKYFNGAGTFTLEIPINSLFREKIAVNSILVTNSGDELIVKNIQTMLKTVKITGYDLNGLLCDRLTLYSGSDTDSDGSDIFSGTTETCVKHYVAFNLADCTVDENRNFPRFGVADDQGRGTANDHNNPRLQSVHDVVCEMCAAAKLGWRVQISDKSSDSTKPLLIFDVAEQVDKSANQSDRNRVIFSVQQHNVGEMTREVGVTAAKNALYLDIDGTVVAYPNGSGEDTDREVKTGFGRREEYCSISGDSMEPAEYSVEAEHNMADRMAETDSLTIDAGNPLDYRSLYDVGDIVTVYDKNRSLELDSVISAVKVRRSGSEYSVKLTLGESKPKLLDSYQKKNEATASTVRKGGITFGSTALTEYKYLTDTSVKYNGITYTIEKDADTGLISKISDSNDNYFEPTINSGITDVALHNAVFWAVAMISGLNPPKEFDYFDDVLWKYNQSISDTDYPVAVIMVNSQEGGTSTIFRVVDSFPQMGLSINYNYISRGDIGATITFYRTANKFYNGISPNQPTYVMTCDGTSNISSWFTMKNCKTMYVSKKPSSIHPALSKRMRYGSKFNLDNTIKFNEVFRLSSPGITGIMLYKWNSYIFLECYYDNKVPIMDKTNKRLDRNTGYKDADIGNNYVTINSSNQVVTERASNLLNVVSVTLQIGDSQYGTSYFSTMLNNLEGNVFFNTFDLCDENGNVLLAKNCDLDFFI